MPKPTLLVLAAGMGGRYGGLKQMDAMGPSGETIIDFSVFDARRAAFGKVVFVIRKDIELEFRKNVGARFERHIPVEYVFQELNNLPSGFSVPERRMKPWGTTHAVLMAHGVIDEPFAVINADDFYGAASYRILAEYLQSAPADPAMVGFVLRNTLSDFGPVARGLCSVNASGWLKEVVEYTNIERDGRRARNIDVAGNVIQLTGDETVSMNMWGFSPTIFDEFSGYFRRFLAEHGGDLKSECYIPTTVNALMSTGHARVRVLRTTDAWFGVTYRQDRASVAESICRLIRGGQYPERLWS